MVVWLYKMANPNLKILETFFEAVSVGDTATLAELYTEDFILEMPFVDFEGVRIEGLDKVAEYLAGALDRFKIQLSLSHIFETTNPDILIAEYTSSGEFMPEGVPYDNRYITIYKFRDGKICEVVEFFNPLRADISLRK